MKIGSRLRAFFVFFILMAAVVVSAAAIADDAVKDVIRVRGSDSMADLVDSLAKEFMKANPNCNIIVSGGSSGKDSFSALLSKEAEIVMQSHDVDKPEVQAAEKKGLEIEEKIVGWGGIVIVVNPSNPVNELTVEQVRKLFTGEYSNWKQVGGNDEPVTVFNVGDNRVGTLEYFTKEFLKAPIAANAVTKAYFRSVIPAVVESKNSAGYVRVRNIVQLQEKGQETKIKILAIKKGEGSTAILPSRASVDDGTYPITRPYYLYMDGKGSGKTTKAFMEFCAKKNPRPM
jgi:phosphate transport system substrate-binding protein